MKDLQELLTRLRRVSTIHILNYEINNDGEPWPMTDQISQVHSEVSEVFDVVRRPQKYDNPFHQMKTEIVDIVYSALTLYHLQGVQDNEIMEAFEEVMRKIEKRVGIDT